MSKRWAFNMSSSLSAQSLVPLYSLDSLGSLFQGLIVSRYQSSFGSSQRVVQVRNLDRLFVDSDLETMVLNAPKLSRYRLLEGDVILSVRGVSQKASMVSSEVKGCIAGQNLAVFRSSSESQRPVNSLYLVALFRSQWLQPSLSRLYGQSSGTRSLSLSQLRQLKVPVPEPDIQSKIAELFKATEEFTIATLDGLKARQKMTEIALFEIFKGI